MSIILGHITLECTGRREYANGGIIGISPNGVTYSGYDDGLGAEEWTPEERAELADYMIARWLEFKAGDVT